MDPELIAYLDQRFRSIDQRFDSIDQRFDSIDQRFDSIDQRFEQVDRRFEQVDRRFEQVDEANRQTRVLIEGVRDDVRQVAEGQAGLNQRVETLEKMAEKAFDTIKVWVEPYYRNLDGRLRSLDDRVRVLEDSGGAPAGEQARRRPKAAG